MKTHCFCKTNRLLSGAGRLFVTFRRFHTTYGLTVTGMNMRKLLSFIILMAVLFSFSCANTAAINKDASWSGSEKKVIPSEKPKPDMYLDSKAVSSYEAREMALHEKELNIPEDNFTEEAREKKSEVAVEDDLFADIYFDTDKSDIKSEYYSRLDKQAEYLAVNDKGFRLIIEGHCDERASIKYNYDLGSRRALAVFKYLVDKGVDKSIIKMVSFGKSEPFDVEKSLSAYAKNRRAHFVLYPK